MERKRIIVITPEEREYLRRLFGVSGVTVWAAVKYHKNNKLHQKIRKAAIERGNPQMVLAPEFDTIYLCNRKDADAKMSRYMVQTFENGATMEGNMITGDVVVRDRKGCAVYVNVNPTITELRAIQEVAMSL